MSHIFKKTPSLSAGFCLLLACSLLFLPIQWVLAAVFAATFHELCHWAAIRLCSREDTPLLLFAFGAKLPLPTMSRSKELLCALAGPVGGLTLLFFARWMPRVAVCAAFQSFYNLLPIYPMDGGRAVQCLMSILLPPKKADHACKIIEQFCLGGLLILAFYGSLYLKLGIFPLILAGSLILRVKFIKMPCKVTPKRVQ